MSRIVPNILKIALILCAGWSAMAVTTSSVPGELHAQQNFDFNDFNNPPRNEEVSPAAVIFVLLFYGVLIAVAVAINVLICYLLYTILKAVPQQFRLMEPGMVWLMLIPCFSLIWIFFVYIRIAKSYRNYFNSIGRYDVGDCGEALGLWYCICVCLCLIPCVNYIAGPAALILMIIYIVKLFGLKGQIGVGFVEPKWGAPM